MLRILGPAGKACDGVTRRELMRIGALSLFSGVSLPRLLKAREALSAARNGNGRATKARSVILLNLFGGPSHLDMFDVKPDAPAEIRGEFQPIRTSVPGLAICEHLPGIARLMHQATLIRTVSHHFNSHHPYAVLTGFAGGMDGGSGPQPSDHPSMGSVLKYLGVGRTDALGYVFMPDYPGYTQNPRPGAHAGYLGSRYDPLFTRCDPTFERDGSFYDPVTPIGDSLLPGMDELPDITIGRLSRRRSLLEQIDASLARSNLSAPVAAMTDFQRQVFSLLCSSKTRDAFDLDRESDRVRASYGRHLYGSSLLIARRLVEAGTTFVAVNWECGVETHGGHWDMHQNNFGMLRFNLPILDSIVTALVEDLQARGLWESTLVIVTGEMGRMPRVNARAGRDHWPQCGFCLMTGGGIKAGMVYGSSDKQGAYPVDHPVSPGDIVATVYQLLGVDPQTTVPDLSGRPIPISHGGEPIWDVLA